MEEGEAGDGWRLPEVKAWTQEWQWGWRRGNPTKMGL